MDALTRAFDFLSSLIRGSEEDGLVVWWRYEGDHAGLAFPQCEGKTRRCSEPRTVHMLSLHYYAKPLVACASERNEIPKIQFSWGIFSLSRLEN